MRYDVTTEEKTRAIQRGVRRALREHALLGRSVPIERDSKIVWLSPSDILEELCRQEQELGFTDER